MNSSHPHRWVSNLSSALPTDASPRSGDQGPSEHQSTWRAFCACICREVRTWRWGVVPIHEVDPWLQFNRFVRHGYRPSRLRKREALASLLYMHNETFNIYSHLIACLACLYCILWPPIPTLFFNAPLPMKDELSSWPPSDDRESNLFFPQREGYQRGSTYAYVEPAGSAAFPSARFLRRRPNGLSSIPSNQHDDAQGILRMLSTSFFMIFLLSIVYHLFMPCCRRASQYQHLLQCDVLGVLISITGSVYVYFVRGHPCTSTAVQTFSAVIMSLSTCFVTYAVVVSPVKEHLWQFGQHCIRGCVDRVAATLCIIYEYVKGERLAPPHPDSENVIWKWLHFHRYRYEQQAHFSRHPGNVCDAQGPRDSTYTAMGEGDPNYHLMGAQSPSSTSTAPPVVVGITAAQRATLIGIHCLLHFVAYLLLVVPKSFAPHGFTQAVYFHGASYLWLVFGGLVNALRLPERVVHYMAIRVQREKLTQSRGHTACENDGRSHRDRRSARGTRNHSGGGESGTSTTWSWNAPVAFFTSAWRFGCSSFAHCVTTYITTNDELNYVGNSHNIWHMCTVMSTLSLLTGAYYDCAEYDLIHC